MAERVEPRLAFSPWLVHAGQCVATGLHDAAPIAARPSRRTPNSCGNRLFTSPLMLPRLAVSLGCRPPPLADCTGDRRARPPKATPCDASLTWSRRASAALTAAGARRHHTHARTTARRGRVALAAVPAPRRAVARSRARLAGAPASRRRAARGWASQAVAGIFCGKQEVQTA